MSQVDGVCGQLPRSAAEGVCAFGYSRVERRACAARDLGPTDHSVFPQYVCSEIQKYFVESSRAVSMQEQEEPEFVAVSFDEKK